MTPSKILQVLLGLIIALGFQATLAATLFYDVPQGNRDIIVYLIGQLAGAFLTVVGFAFGSSVGSQRKDEARSAAAAAAAAQFPPTQPTESTR